MRASAACAAHASPRFRTLARAPHAARTSPAHMHYARARRRIFAGEYEVRTLYVRAVGGVPLAVPWPKLSETHLVSAGQLARGY
jgi:hypothetical protein